MQKKHYINCCINVLYACITIVTTTPRNFQDLLFTHKDEVNL